MAVPSTGSARRTYSEEYWNEMKPHFIRLYRDDKNTLKTTMDRLREQYGFKATEKMYKTHIKRWGLEKYNKDDELLHLIRLDRETGLLRNRSYTINGRVTTVDDAKRHFRRKKVKSLDDLLARLPSQLPDSIEIVYQDDDELLYDFADPISEQDMAAPQLILNTGCQPDYNSEVIDMDMDDRHTLSPDMLDIDPAFFFPSFRSVDHAKQHGQDNHNRYPGALAVSQQFKPSLIMTPGLEFFTHSFLQNMSDFSDRMVSSLQREPVMYPKIRRFNELWDLFCTSSTHHREQRTHQALMVHDTARIKFSRMLRVQDPWLLLSLCLVLNDSLSNENQMNGQSCLDDMSNWTNRFDANHPIVQMVRALQNTSDGTPERAAYLLEATVRMISDRLNQTLGLDHDLSLELTRLHARTMTTIGMHHSAQALLGVHLAQVVEPFGARSQQNFLRLSALARAHYKAQEYQKALALYQKIILDSTDSCDGSSLDDIRYGAMYTISKCHASLGDFDSAAMAAHETLRFALNNKGPDHYWTSNAEKLIDAAELGQVAIGQRFLEVE